MSLLSTRDRVLKHSAIRECDLSFSVCVVPSGAPENVTAEAMSSSRILVTWGPIPEHEQNGNILGYKVVTRENSFCVVVVFIIRCDFTQMKITSDWCQVVHWSTLKQCLLKEPLAQYNKRLRSA